jgi:uncharacterized protein (DUF2236 family)
VDGYFDDSSVMRRVHRERVVALSGPRALLMQAAHPLALAGLLAHTSGLDAPYERLARTARVMDAIAFGPREEADRLTRRVRAMHGRVRGTLAEPAGPYPAGTPYAADDPDLLLWVLFALYDSALVVYRRYVGRLSRAEEAAYWDDWRTIGRLFGLRDSELPATLADADAYRREMLDGDRLFVTDWARSEALRIVFRPPVPLALRPLVESANFVTIALLPEPIFRGYGFNSLPPRRLRAALVAGGAEYVKRVLLPVLPPQLRLVPSA